VSITNFIGEKKRKETGRRFSDKFESVCVCVVEALSNKLNHARIMFNLQ
jgi:hypothetical protein